MKDNKWWLTMNTTKDALRARPAISTTKTARSGFLINRKSQARNNASASACLHGGGSRCHIIRCQSLFLLSYSMRSATRAL